MTNVIDRQTDRQTDRQPTERLFAIERSNVVIRALKRFVSVE